MANISILAVDFSFNIDCLCYLCYNAVILTPLHASLSFTSAVKLGFFYQHPDATIMIILPLLSDS